MNKLYSLLGIGLLSAATLNSCKEDAFLEGDNREQQGELQTYTAAASIEGYKSTEKEPSTRANVQEDGSSFMWNKDDEVTIWNGTAGYDFMAINYDESEPSGHVEFTGEGSLTDGTTVWGIYPKKESPAAANVFSFALSDKVVQNGKQPELKSTMHMLAKGTVNGTTVTNMSFEHLTALFQFKITNRRQEAYKMTKVTVSSGNEAVFPKVLTVSEDEKTYGEMVGDLTLELADMEVAKNEVAFGYMSFFPTMGLTADTELTFTATLENVNEPGSIETIVKAGKISELYNAESVVAEDGYKYVAGKRYSVSFTLIGDPGYEETEPGKYLVKKEAGLINLAGDPSIMTKTDVIIKLNTDLDFTSKPAWIPAKLFSGTLDGNGKVISGLQLNVENATIGLFETNAGTIKNLKIKGASLTGTISAGSNVPVGTFAGKNTGTIQDCILEGGTFNVPANCLYGGFVGQNEGKIINCSITDVSNFTCDNANTNVGGIVGKNMGILEGSYANNVQMSCSKGTIGGLVGWNNSGNAKIVGCYSLVNITLTGSVNSGLLAGGCNWTHVTASFAVGSISAPVNANASRGGLVNQGGTINGCYSIPILDNIQGNAKTGGISGKNGGGQSTFNCFYISTDEAIHAVASGEQTGVEKLSATSALVEKLSELNANTEVAASGYEFVINEGNNKDVVPLLVQKKK